MLGFMLVLLTAQAPSPWGVTGDTQAVSDPTVIRSGSRYVIFRSGPGIPIHVSSDMRSWRRVGQVFAAAPKWALDKVPGATWIWAPDVTFRDGKHWLYYSVSTPGSRRSVIGLATSPTLDEKGPGYGWTDQGMVWETRESDDYNAIDPNAFETPEKLLYLAFGSFWTGLKIVPLDRMTGKPAPGAVPRPIASRPGADAIEGACLFRKGAHTYLFASHDFTGRGLASTYKIVVGRSTNPTGPFVDREGRPMLQGGGTTVVANDAAFRGPGHNAVLQDGDRAWLVYHALDPARNAELHLRIDQINWTADGWPEVARREPSPAGWWEHSVADGPPALVRLLPGGKVSRPDESANWSLASGVLEMRWPNPAAPGGAFVDRCRMSADGRRYTGANQAGVAIVGVRSVIGWWEHRVADGAASMLRLLPDGKINAPDGPNTWKLTGDTLEMRWQDPAAPGGAWVDTVKLDAGRATYEGKNQTGVRLRGWQVASE